MKNKTDKKYPSVIYFLHVYAILSTQFSNRLFFAALLKYIFIESSDEFSSLSFNSSINLMYSIWHSSYSLTSNTIWSQVPDVACKSFVSHLIRPTSAKSAWWNSGSEANELTSHRSYSRQRASVRWDTLEMMYDTGTISMHGLTTFFITRSHCLERTWK